MKKTIAIPLAILILVLTFIAWWKVYEFQYTDICLDMWGWKNPWGYEICVIEKEITSMNMKSIHYTWDMNEDGLNDCESDGSCDDSVDYSIPRYKIEGVEDGIVFDEKSKRWVDKYWICHTCTEENWFSKDWKIIDLD